MSHICADCHKQGKGCCLINEHNNQGYIGISINDINRIKEYSQINQKEFIIEEYKTDQEINLLVKHYHPIFEKIYTDNRCFRLKTIDNHCIFQKKTGKNKFGQCILPDEVRPLYCKIYPFWMTTDNKYITILPSNECLAQRESSISWTMVNKYFNYTEEHIKNLFSQILSEYNNHAKIVKDMPVIDLKDNYSLCNFRKLQISDLPRIKEICIDIWDGDDYMPYIAEKWVNDSNGEFIGLEINKTVYGLCKLSINVPDIVWIEGLRADPHCNIKGIANAFYQYILKHVKDNYPQIEQIELSSYFDNIASNKIALRNGFELINKASFKLIELNNYKHIRNNQKPDINVITNTEIILQFLFNSDFNLSNRLFLGWKGIPIENRYIKYLKTLASKKIVHYNFKEQDFELNIGVNYNNDKNETNLIYISYNQPLNKDLLILFNNAINFIIKKSIEQEMLIVQMIIPIQHPLLSVINETAFISYDQEEDFYLYRKFITNS
ncbi:MAG: GNAT family N-acetyltransferase [Candidatus Cloacimonetes bacterium]|nr:GNAT family N-acetyltransferase [Candidatus Cloacimonadota bacterium]